MDNNIMTSVFCGLWMLAYSAALSNGCCHVSRIEGGNNDVTCSGCRLQVVPQDLPINTTVLNLRNNSLNNLNRKSFINLPTLRNLDLSMNGLSTIESGAFEDIQNLEYLDISENKLNVSTFEPSVFHRLKSLKYLNIQRNNFHLMKSYPEQALSYVSQLETLTIDIFEGFSFGNGFLHLSNLNNLTFNFVGKEWVSFRNSSFLGLRRSNISYLNIKVPIRQFEIDFLSPLLRLTTLELNSERTMTIHDILRSLHGLRGREMESLTLSFNYVLHNGMINLDKLDFLYLGTICVKKLELTDNAIESISMKGVLSWTSRTCLEVLDLSRNQFYTNQFLTFLILFPSITALDFSYMGNVPRRKRKIPYNERHICFVPKSLLYLNFSHNGIGEPMANVTFAKNNVQVVDVSFPTRNPSCSNGLVKGLVHMKEFDMFGVDCSSPNTKMFSEMPNLVRLGAGQCNLKSSFDSNKTSLLKGLYNLSFIDISSNNINRLNIRSFEDQKESLKILILSRNHMERLPTEILQYLSVLETLDVSNNVISTLSKSECSQMDALQLKSNKLRIDLFGNPLVCSCDTLDFISWISTTLIINNRKSLLCITPDGTQMKIGKFLETFDQFQDSCVSQFWLIITVVLSAIVFALGIISREQWRRSVWLRVMCRHPLESDTYENDIFISYCDVDSGWVAKTFVPWLNDKDIEYCFDEKSFKPGLDIADNIMDAIDNSHQTVFVVSCAFLEREWTMFSMKLASAYSFRDGRENMNIMIMLNDIKKSEFPKLIRTNWDVIRPLSWPNESNIDQGKLKKAKELFWKRLFKRIKRDNANIAIANVCESNV